MDSLSDVTTMESLISRYQEIDSGYVVPIAKSLEMPQLVVLNYELTLSVAFYLRGREIVESQALSRTEDFVSKAKENGDEWILIYDNKTEHNGYTFFNRLEMHIPDGISLHISSELDLEKGRIFSVEPMLLDSKTGHIKKDSDSLGPRQEFLTKKNLMSEVNQLRKKYSR